MEFGRLKVDVEVLVGYTKSDIGDFVEAHKLAIKPHSKADVIEAIYRRLPKKKKRTVNKD